MAGLTGVGQGRAYRSVTDGMAGNPDPADWIHFRRTYDSQGYSPLTQALDAANGETKSNPRNFGRLGAPDNSADGMAVDAGGRLYVAPAA